MLRNGQIDSCSKTWSLEWRHTETIKSNWIISRHTLWHFAIEKKRCIFDNWRWGYNHLVILIKLFMKISSSIFSDFIYFFLLNFFGVFIIQQLFDIRYLNDWKPVDDNWTHFINKCRSMPEKPVDNWSPRQRKFQARWQKTRTLHKLKLYTYMLINA